MERHFYISDDISELNKVSIELQEKGVSKPQIHLITPREGASHLDSLTPVEGYFYRSNFQKILTLSFIVILTLAIASVSLFLGLNITNMLWIVVPIFLLFLYVYHSASFTSESGIRTDDINVDQEKLKNHIDQGRAILLIEMRESEQSKLDWVIAHHPKIEYAGFHNFIFN